MDFKSMVIKKSYVSYGNNDIVSAFLLPVLKYTKNYRRSVGFFSSSVLDTLLEGISELRKNKGKIQLIASPRISEEDKQAIEEGYNKREEIITRSFDKDFIEEINKLEFDRLQLLSKIIAEGTLDIKIACVNNSGIYHDKLGIMEDFAGNTIVFYGSPNSSYNAYKNNYEKIRIVKSWYKDDKESVDEEIFEFDQLWNGKNDFVHVYEYKDCAAKNILEVIKEKRNIVDVTKDDSGIKLRDYQEDAINAWVGNGYKGFFVMATGTGKTWTAIYAAKRLCFKHAVSIVICAPYKHLVKQWYEDVKKVFTDAKIFMVSSENHNWSEDIINATIVKRYNPNTQIIIITTIASFKLDRFEESLSKLDGERLIIVDEAHRFKLLDESIHEKYPYMLGLSATPFSGKNANAGRMLMDFFGGEVYNLPIEGALERGFLVPYKYHPIFVHATEEEEKKFSYYTKQISSCFKNNICINEELLVKALRGRLRVISMAKEKQNNLESIISNLNVSDHFIVYCGDGRVFNSHGEEVRHIKYVKGILNGLGFMTSQFTAQENMNERMQLVNIFNSGEISSLVAIRCLDEGINIPSIKSALILSSNDDYREFVQRRGRILRLYKGKDSADIYDVIVLPSGDTPAMALIELKRYNEYAKLASNYDEIKDKLYNLLDQYGYTEEDINVYDYEEMEVLDDEL